jgi:hypothetical protein
MLKIARRPPVRNTRNASRTIPALSRKWWSAYWQAAKSNVAEANGNAELSPWTQPISADLVRAWRSMPSDPSSPIILALGAIARLATSWLPVPQAMSKSTAVPRADRSARNAASAGSGDFSRCAAAGGASP